MPTVFKHHGYRFYFYSNEHLPEHIHVENGDGYAHVVSLVQDNRKKIEGAWNEYFN